MRAKIFIDPIAIGKKDEKSEIRVNTRTRRSSLVVIAENKAITVIARLEFDGYR